MAARRSLVATLVLISCSVFMVTASRHGTLGGVRDDQQMQGVRQKFDKNPDVSKSLFACTMLPKHRGRFYATPDSDSIYFHAPGSHVLKTPGHRARRSSIPGDLRGSMGPVADTSADRVVYQAGGYGARMKLRRHLLEQVAGGAFSAQVWVRAEGGQHENAIILGLHDNCLPDRTSGWRIGLSSFSNQNQKADVRFFFSMKTDRTRNTSRLASHTSYIPGRWTQIVVVYDQVWMRLYIDGVLVSASEGQSGIVFSNALRQCKEVSLGGGMSPGHEFRGEIGHVRLWNAALSQPEVMEIRRDLFMDHPINHADILDPNSALLDQWRIQGLGAPRILQSTVDVDMHDVSYSTPPCGESVCDDPDVVMSYVNQWQLRKSKTIRYQIINIYDENGSHPVVSPEEIQMQHQALQTAFEPRNISFQMAEIKIFNSTLRQKEILFGCPLGKIGDGSCHEYCVHDLTGQDGGDCDVSFTGCLQDMVGDGICQNVCNRRYYDWDGGDCCSSTATNDGRSCADPNAPNRSYLTMEEYYAIVNLPNDDALNVHFAQWASTTYIGVATFPWDKKVFSTEGGIVLKPSSFGQPGEAETLVHEMGHALGLWHVHHGVSELPSCDSTCQEQQASLTVGDLCSDTKPTAAHWQGCRDPNADPKDTCRLGPFSDTPYSNYMSYAGDNCTHEFTAQQAARMHCYLDHILRSWQPPAPPSVVPLPPKVLSTNATRVTLAWTPPIGKGNLINQPATCRECTDEGVFVQYASRAASPQDDPNIDISTATQATGPPDSGRCDVSEFSWQPFVNVCPSAGCNLDLHIEHHVVPSRILLWVPYSDEGTLGNIHLFFEDDELPVSLGPLPVQCDMPLTIPLDVARPLHMVRVYSHAVSVAIDAMRVESIPADSRCQLCPQLTYIIHREPPFNATDNNTENITMLNHAFFVDRSVEEGVTYAYSVSASFNGETGESSTPLVYTHGGQYCGDGLVRPGVEDCDDANSRDGDGCDITCRVEADFRCTGSPSLCYRPSTDGICESWEVQSNVAECGIYTPPGFTSQWPVSAETSSHCVQTELTTPVSFNHIGTCLSASDDGFFWPLFCMDAAPYWIQVDYSEGCVATSVTIYHASTHSDATSTSVVLSLITHDDRIHTTQDVELNSQCALQPAEISIMHDLSKTFLFTNSVRLTLTSHDVTIHAISLQCSIQLQSLLANSCQRDELFNVQLGACVHYDCERQVCPELYVKSGSVNCSGHQDGDSCSITCNTGYYLDGDNRPICESGIWSGAVSCLPVDCQPPQISRVRADCPDGHTLGSRCKLECISPARRRGLRLSIECESDGLWSAPEGFCQVVCVAPPIVKNGTVITRLCRGRSEHDLGTSCRARCERGYHIDDETNSPSFNLECGEDGNWHGPQCVPVQCPAFPVLYYGLYSCTDDYNAGSVCLFKCPGPNTLSTELLCTDSGAWSRQPPICRYLPEPCPPPPPSDQLTFICPQFSSIGSQCVVTCTEPGRFAYQPIPGGHAGHVREVNHVTCTGSRTWYPLMDSFVCLQRCMETFQDDGFCDPANNRLHCNWDGGDCCPSTSRMGRIVAATPGECGPLCQCLDPGADENQLPNQSIRHNLYYMRKPNQSLARHLLQRSRDTPSN